MARSEKRSVASKNSREDPVQGRSLALPLAFLALVVALGGLAGWLTATYDSDAEALKSGEAAIASIAVLEGATDVPAEAAPVPEPDPVSGSSPAGRGEEATQPPPGDPDRPAATEMPAPAPPAASPGQPQEAAADHGPERTAGPAPAPGPVQTPAPTSPTTPPPALPATPAPDQVAALPPEQTAPSREVPAAAGPPPSTAPSAERETTLAALPPQNSVTARPPPPDDVGALGGPVPDPELVFHTDFGPLPIIGADGRQSWQVYARPFEDPHQRPRIAIVVSDMGLSQSATNTAIQQLPGTITLAFAPFAKNLQEWILAARAAGHETLLQIPMEPYDYPDNDPGPYTLLTNLTPGDNIQRLEYLLSRASGYAGITSFMGARFTSSEDDMRPVIKALHDRGLMLLDSRASRFSVAGRVATEIGAHRALNNRFIDSEPNRTAIDGRLHDLERIAAAEGSAIGIALGYPVTIERLAEWAATLNEKGLVLAPVSALVDRQEVE
ncbi:divergent polysaccharide deacetylase family protein [Oceanibacterium hippocampi]|uniref:Divergent polysaccharide deacetylase n=1 Tax=Oceanibacterium hippocampi TaxID=745714 RepID=A0A1Y5RBG8_9PROT|nr:divergent polysaccharide deacetylase family protein [Oceanibacterium hippocampi]SLN13452.1 Divergent polysaccharide deacetylase [Oceanibacterium hippocampi]